jgi:outer membrane protein
MKVTAAAFFVAVLALPAVAQDRYFDLTANYVWMDPTGGGTFEDLTDPRDIELDTSTGYGAAVNIFFGDRLSVEFAAAMVEADAQVRRRSTPPAVAGGTLEMIPVTAVLQWHFAPGAFIDPYIGGGAAYVIYDYSSSESIEDFERVDIDDDVGFAVNAGVGIRLGERFAINLDGKYVPIESNARAVILTEDSEGRIDVSPVIISAGLSLRF